MRLSALSFIVGWLSCPDTVAAQKASAAAVASGAAEAAVLNGKAADVQKKLEKEVGEMVLQSTEKVKSLKSMLTTNSKAMAALTGLFKEVSRLTSSIDEYEGQLRQCKKDLAQIKSQQQAGPENDAFFNSASSDPLAGISFFQKEAETALAHATRVFHELEKKTQGLSLLQRHHRHQRRSSSEDEDAMPTAEDSVVGESTAADSDSDSESTSDAISFGMNTIGAGEEDMDSRVKNIDRNKVVMPGSDPLEYGMYDFTGSHGVKIFDHDSLDPDIQRKRELEAVNRMTIHDQDDSEDDD
jgi:hypothetical protein